MRRRKTVDHVVILDGGKWRCLHCRAEYDPFKGQAQPIGAISVLAKWFTKEHRNCSPPSAPECCFCGSRDHDWLGHVNATCKTPSDWLGCGDTGVSSRAIYRHMMGMPQLNESGFGSYPQDPADLGRCVRLLDAPWAKEWRGRIEEMRQYKGWDKLVPRWADIESLYREEVPLGKASRCYALMKELLER